MTKKLIGSLLAICCLSLTAFSQTTEQSKPVPAPKPKAERFSAVASLPRAATRSAWVDVRINRYTSNATTQRLAAVLVEGGQDALVKELEKAKPVGHASLSARIGFFDLKLIRSRKTPTGRRIIGVSDRPIGFLEAYGGGRSTGSSDNLITEIEVIGSQGHRWWRWWNCRILIVMREPNDQSTTTRKRNHP